MPAGFKRVSENFWLLIALIVFWGSACLSIGSYSIVAYGKGEPRVSIPDRGYEGTVAYRIGPYSLHGLYGIRVAAGLKSPDDRINLSRAKIGNSEGTVEVRHRTGDSLECGGSAVSGARRKSYAEDCEEVQKKMEALLEGLGEKTASWAATKVEVE